MADNFSHIEHVVDTTPLVDNPQHLPRALLDHNHHSVDPMNNHQPGPSVQEECTYASLEKAGAQILRRL
jgi:hypothetical protein